MLDFSVTFVITIINIAVLFFILKAILFKPVTKFISERTKRVEDSIEQSERDKAQARALLEKYEAQMKKAEADADAIIQDAKEHALREAEKIIAEGRITAEKTLVSTRKELEFENKAAIARFRQEAAAIVVAAAGRLLEREIKSQDCLQYADMLLSEISLPGEAGHT
jgi:F-type H+-transporting ATPase subunit b